MPRQMPSTGALRASASRSADSKRSCPLHAEPERRDPGQHHPRRRCDGGGIGDERGVAAGAPERLHHRAEVSQAQIHHRHVHSTPFVLGTVPARRGSNATAWRSARCCETRMGPARALCVTRDAARAGVERLRHQRSMADVQQ